MRSTIKRSIRFIMLAVLLLGSLLLVNVSGSQAQSTGYLALGWGDNYFGQCNVPAPNSGFVAVSAGSSHSLGLRSDGSIAAWGFNYNGQCNVPAPNSGFVAVSAGSYHSLGLRSDGSIAAWGWNEDGQCNVPAPNSGFVAVSAGSSHSLGLRSDGSIAAWGWNNNGQLNVPAPNSGFTAVSAGSYHSLGLRSDGSIAAWGDNWDGQCNVPAPNSGFVAVSAGAYHSLGLRSDGSIAAWGWNEDGQCNVPAPNSGFVAMDGGSSHSLGLRSDGSIAAWGLNNNGQCNVPAPNSGFVAVAGGMWHSLSLRNAHTVNAAVFYTGHGSVGPASQTVLHGSSASVDLVPDLGYHAAAIYDNGLFKQVSDPYVISYVSEDHEVIAVFEVNTCLIGASVDGSGSVGGTGTYEYGATATLTATPSTGWRFAVWTEGEVEVSGDASYSFTVAGARSLVAHFALDGDDYGVAAWGDDYYGQCDVPAPNTRFTAVTAGMYHSLGLKSDGSVAAWGGNGDGQINVPAPNTGFTAVSAGAYHSLGLKADGSIAAWGDDYYGQCDVSAPNTGYVAVSAGYFHSLGLRADGSVAAWGDNTYGQLNVPAPNSGFVAVSAGSSHSLGLRSDGSVVAWGYNYYGQCDVPAPNTGFTAVSAGAWFCMGLKADGSVAAWGSNGNGELDVPAPNSGFVAVSAGYAHSLGLKADGSVAAWGDNGDGQLDVPAPNTGFVAVAAGGYHSLALRRVYEVNASVFHTGHGSVNPASQTVLRGQNAAVDLVPNTGYHVAYLYDNGVFKNAADPYVINYLTEGHDVVAVFEPNTYTVNATVAGSGGVSGAGDYEYGTIATLTATPAAGWHFVNWTEGFTEVSTDASYSFTVAGARDLTAHFALDSYEVNASVFYTGHGTVDPSTQTVLYGDSASIDLVPDAGYQAVYVLDSGVSVPVSDPYVLDDVREKHNVTVFFDIESYLIGVDADGDGSVNGGGIYEYGDLVTVSAAPDPGWYFVNWTEGGVEVSTDESYSFAAVSDRDLIAHFAPIPTDTWYLAEGCTMDGTETWVLVENPNPFPVTLDLTLVIDGGVVFPPELDGYLLAPETRVSFDVGAYAQSYDLSTIVKATGGDIVVERSMYGQDRTWASCSVGTREPGTDWYLAEGSTGEGFETWVLVFNPNKYNDVTCSLDFMTSNGTVSGPQDVRVHGLSRYSFKLNDYLTDYDVSSLVTATGPVVVERAMYGADRAWAHASIGTSTPAPDWYLAEGSTGEGFETWVLVQNPGDNPVTCDLTLMTSAGSLEPPELQDVALADHSRRSFRLNDYTTDYDVSTVVSSSGGEVIAERSMYDTSRTWGTCSIGAQTPAPTWYLAEGCTGEGFETWVLVQNPGASTVEVDLDFFTSAGEQAGPHDVLIPAYSRRSFRLNDYLTDYNVSTVVSASRGVVVERAMYGDERAWATDSIGVIGFPAIPGIITTIPVGDEPYGIGVNSVTNRVYVTNVFDGTVSVINGATDTVTATVPVGVEPYSAGVNPDTNRVYVTNLADDNVSVIDGATNTVTAVIPVGSGPEGICVNPATNRIYVANGGSGTVSVIDGATNTVMDTIAVGVAPWGIAVNPVTNRVYVANNSDDSLSVIDGATNTVIATVAVGDDPRAVAVNPATNRVYVANFYSDDVTVIDGTTNTVTATVVTGSSHMGVGVDAVTNEIYVSNMFGYNVSVIDGATNTVKGTVTVGSAPSGIGVNPVSGKVYVVNGMSDDVSVL